MASNGKGMTKEWAVALRLEALMKRETYAARAMMNMPKELGERANRIVELDLLDQAATNAELKANAAIRELADYVQESTHLRHF